LEDKICFLLGYPKFRAKNKFSFISKLVDQIFHENLPGDQKERQLVPQASAGYPLFINPVLAFRKAQRGREKNGSEK
jgi:hypothetical protein